MNEFYHVQTGWLRARQSLKLTGACQVTIFSKAEWDSVPDDFFAMPADVKAAEGSKKASGD